MTIFVGNLPYSATEVDVENLFKVKTSARIIMDRELNRSKGFGFIDFDTAEIAKAELKRLKERPIQLGGRTLVFNEAEHKAGPGNGGGYRGGNGGGAPRRDRDARRTGVGIDYNG